MINIATYSVKGGTGKSTLARVLAEGFGKMSEKTLICEVDGQANTSKQLSSEVSAVLVDDVESYGGLDESKRTDIFIEKFIHQNEIEGTAAVFSDPKCIKDTIRSTKEENVDMVPANLQLFLTDTKLRLENGRQENRLSRAMNYIKRDYSFCIFDCSPVKSLLINNVMYTDPLVLIPVVPTDDAMQGLALVLNELKEIRGLYEELILDYRIVIVMKSSNNEARRNIDYIRNVFQDRVLDTEIRFQAKPIEAACQQRKSILDFDAPVASDFKKFVEEVSKLCKTSYHRD